MRLLGGRAPQRIAVDSITPIVEAGTASAACVTALLNFLDGLGATSLITHPGDLRGRFDRRLEPLTQRAAAILHLSAERDRTGTLEIQKVRFAVLSTAPISFVIRPGVGIAAANDGLTRRANDVPVETRRKLLVLTENDAFPPELLGALRNRFDVAVRERAESAFAQLAQSALGAVILNVNRDSIDNALGLVRELRRGGSRSPIALVTSFTLRSHDRARALRAGADDFFVALHPEEFLLRVESLVQRGRSSAVVSPEPVRITHDSANGSGVLDESAFRNAVQSQLAADALAFFTLVRLSPVAAPAGVDELAALARAQIRSEGGDIVGRIDGAVTVYLYSARRKDVEPFIRRIRDAWRAAGRGELDVATAAYPSEEVEMHAMLGAQPA
jgi:DNA-binding NarL/FixJ family response regulator